LKTADKPALKTISKNRKLHQRFSVLEALEAGISLYGYEVKSLRAGRASIEEGVIKILHGEAVLMGVHIPPYEKLSHVDYDPIRSRKLLLHRREINKLEGQVMTKGLTILPLELYFKNGVAKVTVGLVKSKNVKDRREEIKRKDSDREIQRKYRPRSM